MSFNLLHLSLPKQFPLFILASSVCKSLQCLISALTQGGEGGHLFSLTCSVALWGGRNAANKYHWHVWGVLAVSWPHWVCPLSQHVCFHGLHFSSSRLLCQELFEVSSGLRALPRSKPLRFRFSGIPQRCRLGWACVLCPSQVRAAQATRCLASAVSPGGECILSPPRSSRWVSWMHSGSTVTSAVCLLWGTDLWLQSSWRMSVVQEWPRGTMARTGF